MVGNLAREQATGRLPAFLCKAMDKQKIGSVRQLAIVSGINYHTLRDALYEGNELGVFKAKALADALELDLNDLIKHLPRKQ